MYIHHTKILSICLTAAFFFTVIDKVSGQTKIPTITAIRTQQAPVIDGKLDDKCWAQATVATAFMSHNTHDSAKEQTIVRILYDDENLYVAFECIEPEPEKIQATERKYDRSLRRDDWVQLQIDTLGDRRSAYMFRLNALGTRWDAKAGLFSRNVSWECNWQAACTIGKTSWLAEMAIPIEELFFVRGSNVSWGINFHRCEKGQEENSTWAYNKDETYSPKWFGKLTGLDLSSVVISPRPKTEVYVSGVAKKQSSSDQINTGTDVSLRLNEQFTSAFTVNPDFGQVEADTDTIELRDTERFLPERRSFFREGAELFQTPFNVYYSRRIQDIKTGAKVTGMGQDWTLGLLDVEGEISRDDELVKGNYLVGRATRNIGVNSHVGAIFVNSERQNGYNRLGGFDSNLYLSDTCKWTSQMLGMIDEEKRRDPLRRSEYAWKTSLESDNRPLYWDIDLLDISEHFNPDLGYIPRRNIRGGRGKIELKDYLDNGPIEWGRVRTAFTIYENHSSQTVLRDYYQQLRLNLRNRLDFMLWRFDSFHIPHKNQETGIWLAYNRQDYWHSISGGYSHGVFEGVSYDGYSLSKPFKLGQRLTTTLTGNYRLEHPDEGDRSVWLWRLVSEYTFPSQGRLKFTIERTSQDRHNLTLLYALERYKNTDVYIVLTDLRDSSTVEQGVFGKIVYRF